jgi:hypothetical protein
MPDAPAAGRIDPRGARQPDYPPAVSWYHRFVAAKRSNQELIDRVRKALDVAHDALNELEQRLRAAEGKRTREGKAISDVQVFSIIDPAKIDKLMAKGKLKRK